MPQARKYQRKWIKNDREQSSKNDCPKGTEKSVDANLERVEEGGEEEKEKR